MAWGGLFLSLGRPTQEQRKSCLAAAGGFNYAAALHGASRPSSMSSSEEGETSSLAERGFFVNRSRLLLGSGGAAFGRARSGLRSWRHLALGWAEVEPGTPVREGARFCICCREAVPWVMLPLQIAYVVDDGGGGVFGFGSGTLQGHLLAGEERFSVRMDEDGRVWYEVLSFSKPAHPLSALCYPYVKLRQRQFAHHSGQALLTHVIKSSSSTSNAAAA
jgi:uncharacterized protein (UPF0548 family)